MMSFSSSPLLEEDTSKNSPSLLERKREKMLDRLRETEHLRKQKRDASRREHEAKTDPTENVETFAKAFKEVVENIERDIIGGSAAGRRVERTEEEKEKRKKHQNAIGGLEPEKQRKRKEK